MKKLTYQELEQEIRKTEQLINSGTRSKREIAALNALTGHLCQDMSTILRHESGNRKEE